MTPNFPKVQYSVVAFGGGLDQVTPTLALKSGVLRESLNFECNVSGGYTSIMGYERFDGRNKPSDANFVVVSIAPLPTSLIYIGTTVIGSTSSQSGTVIGFDSSTLIVANPTGDFTTGEVLQVGGIGVATMLGYSAADTPKQSAIYKAAAADVSRSVILPPPGSGAVRGVFGYNGDYYCFRDNAGATACVMYKATTSGWVAVSFEYEVSFSAGTGATTAPAIGATLTQGGITATVRRVLTRTGVWAATSGTAQGTMVISVPSGGHFSAGAATVTGGYAVTLGGAEAQISLLPGGHLRTVTETIFGSATARRVYGADGKNPAWEFDGTNFIPIHTGMATDTPKHIAAHKNHLFLSFGSSVQYSGLSDPYSWSVVLGAGEINAGEDVTGFNIQPGSGTSGAALAIYTTNSTQVLYGAPGGSSMQLVTFNTGVGGLNYTAQNLVDSFVLDNRGVMTLTTTLNYGNFDTSSLTYNMRPWIISKRQNAKDSCVNREKSQYRVFFSDGSGLYVTVVNGQFLGALPVYFNSPVSCIWNGEDSNGNEVTFFGSDDGYVYQLDSGTSFDGENIAAYITANYDTAKSPRILKSYKHASVEVFGSSYAEVMASYKLGYSSPSHIMPNWDTYSSSLMSGGWDGTVSWDSGATWDSQTVSPVEIPMCGTAENIALSFVVDSNYQAPITITTAIIHYITRRGLR